MVRLASRCFLLAAVPLAGCATGFNESNRGGDPRPAAYMQSFQGPDNTMMAQCLTSNSCKPDNDHDHDRDNDHDHSYVFDHDHDH
jgi:hypothetical protein